MADEPKGILSRLLTETWPAKAAGGLLDALMLPGQVAGGILNVQPSRPGYWSDEDEARSQLTNQTMMNRATDLGGLMLLGASGAPAMPNTVGMGVRGYHGSSKAGITEVLANPTSRQYDNATSQFGGFFAPQAEGAARYGKNVYTADIDLKKPYEMPWSEFARFQAPNKSATGEAIPGNMWGPRMEELKAEATALRAKLSDAGHDGVIIRKPNGEVYEIASFGNVPVTPAK